MISSASALGLEGITNVVQTAMDTGKDLSKQLTYKKVEKQALQLYKDMKRDLYQKMTYKRIQGMAKHIWKIHQPSRVLKDPAFRTVFGIYGILAVWILSVEAIGYLANRMRIESGHPKFTTFLIGASGAFFVVCGCGMQLGFKLI